jgi:hypothetical protein
MNYRTLAKAIVLAGLTLGAHAAMPLRTPIAAQGSGQPATAAASYTCLQVIGFSQTANYYSEAPDFEKEVEDSRWQLLWNNGASVNQWMNPNYAGWSRPLFSPCAKNSETPDRVLLHISGSSGEDVSAWVQDISKAISTIRQKVPSARQIILQPVIGGPNGQQCPLPSGGFVRASVQHPYIVRAIEEVAASSASGNIVAGMKPQVRSCEDYMPDIGHLAPAAKGPMGKVIGAFYKNF